MIKKIIAQAFITFFIASCGFQVIYREADNENKNSYEEELATIRIQKEGGRLSQELRNALKDTLNPDYIDAEPKYILSIDMQKMVGGTFITATGASGRNRVTLTLSYRLIDANSGKILSIGSTIVNDNYDVQDNRYATYVAEDYVRTNLTKTAALNIRNLLVNDLIEIKKNANIKHDEPLTNGVYTSKEEKEKIDQNNAKFQASCVENENDLEIAPALKTP